MPNRIASILETTTIIATLVAGVFFTYDAIGTSTLSVPAEVATVAAVSSFSSAPARAAGPNVLRVVAVCGESNCGPGEVSSSHAIPDAKTPGF
ncbi:MAG TPA: hypothetical protein VK479_02285 [Micropepsaceae bacterium]|nr:hypothetical protein [Micropepsaceae bacterium]